MKKIYFSLLLLFFAISTIFAQLEGTTWKLAPTAQAMAVGPTKGDFSWWSNSAADVDTRACLFDDKFVFEADGTFKNIQDGETWLETWQGIDAEGCGAPVAPHDGSGEASWSYDEPAGTITITGTGAHIGLAKVHNGGELSAPSEAPNSITYPVAFEGTTMTIDIDFGGTGFWHFVFEQETGMDSEPEPMDTELTGTWKLAPMAQALAVGPTKGDFSWWSNSDGDVSTRACLFDDKFVFEADGTFQNVQDGETWLEAWQGVESDGCGASVAPHDGSNAATWSFDESTGMVTLTGVGAHLGLAKVHNGGELTAPSEAPASITYPVVIEGNVMTVDIDFGGGFWHFVFEKETETTTEPTSAVGGTWKLAPMAQALAVGPTLGDFSWWSNSDGDVSTRACLFDDKFVFEEDGTFKNIQDGETWLEAWQGVESDGCGTPIAPHDGSNAATWAYDEAVGTITLSGVGAHLGLAKVTNSGELSAPSEAPESITYPVMIEDNTMTIDIDFGGGFWHFVFVKDDGTTPDPEPEPETSDISFGVDMNGYSETFTTVYVSGNLNEWSGDANPLSDEDGDGIWTGTIPLADGKYEYKFTLDSWAVQEEFAGGEDCTLTTGEFTNRLIEVTGEAGVCFKWNSCEACEEIVQEPATIAGIWKLAPIAQALAVGPALGDFSWWSNSAADVETRACLFDDKFVFNEDGSFMNVMDGDTWLETWQGVEADGCGVPIAPHDGSIAATWSFDEAAGTITLSGLGAHLGLAKVHNGGELSALSEAVESITYPFAIEGNTMTIDVAFGETGYWHFVLEKEASTSTNFEVVNEELFNFYPNPASGQIQINSEENIDELIIHDITGKVVLQKNQPSNNETVDVSNFIGGLYIIQVRVENKIAVKKLSIH